MKIPGRMLDFYQAVQNLSNSLLKEGFNLARRPDSELLWVGNFNLIFQMKLNREIVRFSGQ